MKVVISKGYGLFSLSDLAKTRYDTLGGDLYDEIPYRANPILVQVIEELGEAANGSKYSTLKIVEIPDDVNWEIADYDGSEWV